MTTAAKCSFEGVFVKRGSPFRRSRLCAVAKEETCQPAYLFPMSYNRTKEKAQLLFSGISRVNRELDETKDANAWS